MEISEALDFVRQRHFGVLATQRRDGRPQLSNIAYFAQRDLNIDPNTGLIVGDPKALAMTGRTYEKGWAPKV